MDHYPAVLAKDLSNLITLVNWAEDMQIRGSFSERHPNLGKMRNCLKCGRRRREFGPTCCNTAYAKDKKGKECPERMIDAMFSKSFMKRFTHKRHGQNRNFKISELIRRFQENEELLESAVTEMQCKKPDLAGIPAFAEKYWYWKAKLQSRRIKNQQKESRRINANL